MPHLRRIYNDLPDSVPVPEELRHCRAEVIILALDEEPEVASVSVAVDENGWPLGFFEKFTGCLADDPIERAPQGEYEVREALE